MFSNVVTQPITVLECATGVRKAHDPEQLVELAKEHASKIVESCGPRDSIAVSMAITKILVLIVIESCGREEAEKMLGMGNEFIDHLGVDCFEVEKMPKA